MEVSFEVDTTHILIYLALAYFPARVEGSLDHLSAEAGRVGLCSA